MQARLGRAVEVPDAVGLALHLAAEHAIVEFVKDLPHHLDAAHCLGPVISEHRPFRCGGGILSSASEFGGLSRSSSSLIRTALASTRKPSTPRSSQKRITLA